MTIIISFGVALLFGLINGISSIRKSIDKFIEENNYPDIKIITNLEDIDKTASISDEEIKDIEYRLSISTVMHKNNKVLSVKANTYEDKDLKDFYISEEKENNSGSYDILVEKRFAMENNIKLGDTIKLKMGNEFYDFCVTKIISIPETTGNVPINGLWVHIKDYGNVFINRNILKEETNKVKISFLDEIKKKEEEILNEQNKLLSEYTIAKNEIEDSLEKYNTQKESYETIKTELNQKKDEINKGIEELTELKKEYIETTNSINDLKNTIYAYINSYESLSDDTKDYINKIIESKYPNITIEDLEFVTDLAYSILESNINEVFDPNSEINQKIKNKIMIADIVKMMLEIQYNYLNSDEVVSLVDRIKNGEDVKDLPEYVELKGILQLTRVVTDDNIVYVYEVAKVVLNEIHEINNKLPFDSFTDLYNFVDSSRVLLPYIYNLNKDKLEPYYEKIVTINNSLKNAIKNEVESIYNSNTSGIEKAKTITNKVFDYIQSVADEAVVAVLSEYTNDTSGGPLAIIDRLLNEASKKDDIDRNIKEIDDGLNSAYMQINNKQKELEETFTIFKNKILLAKQELDNKKIEIENIHGYENKYNEILINVKDKNNKEVVLQRILDNYLKDVEVLDSYTYERSPMYNFINVYMDPVDRLSTIVPIVFYIIILIVLFLFISLIIKQGKKEIAILKLLGKTNNQIKLGFCISNLIVAVIGLALGFIVGLLLMLYIVQYFKAYFLLPTVVYKINGESIILSIVVTVIVVELATIIATLKLNKITPIELLKNEEYQNREISKFTRFITNKFKPFKKFSILVYLRNKSKLILGIICTSATVALLFSSLAYIASKNKIFNNYFEDRIHYSAQIFKNGAINDEELEELRNLDYIQNADMLRYFNVKIRNNNKEQDIVINALDNKNKYISIYDKNNKEIDYPENGIVLEEHIAKDLGLNVNDEVTIQGIKFKIVDICFQGLGRINYISLADSYKLKSSFDTIVLNMDTSKENELINKVSSSDNYIYTVFNDEAREYNKKAFDSYTTPAIIIIIFTIIIGYIIIININSYNLLDQRRNLSIFRSLGFQYSEISRIWFVQTLTQWIISIIIGLPCGILLSKFFLKAVSSVRREFIYASGIKEAIFTAILLFIYMYIGHKKCMRDFRKMDIIEEIKDRD